MFLGLGSNIDPEDNLRRAAKLLRKESPAIVFSSVYRSSAMYEEKQPDFLNAVARMETEMSPQTILCVLQKIESTLKKNPPIRFGPRTIDLDILLYDNVIRSFSLPATTTFSSSERDPARQDRANREATHRLLDSSPRTVAERLVRDSSLEENILSLPHPRMHERRFVLAPLCELLDPHTTHPVLGKSWQELLKETEKQRCEKLSLIL